MKTTLCVFLILVCLVVAAAQQRVSELSGYVKNANNTPAQGVVVSVGSFSVATDANGYYKFGQLKPGQTMVSISPKGKVTRSFTVRVADTPTRQDFRINW